MQLAFDTVAVSFLGKATFASYSSSIKCVSSINLFNVLELKGNHKSNEPKFVPHSSSLSETGILALSFLVFSFE